MASTIHTENIPVTLKRIHELFTWEQAKDNDIEKYLLGDAYDKLYAKQNGEGLLSESGRSKIRNYTDKQCAHNGQKNVFFTFFAADDEKGKELQEHLRTVWLKKISTSDSFDFEKTADSFLADPLMKTAKPGSRVKDIKNSLESYRNAVDETKQAEFMTLLTIVAITRVCVEDLPDWVLLKNDGSIMETAPELEEIQKGKDAMERSQWQEAIDIFENLERFFTDKKSRVYNTEKRLLQYNARVTYLISEAYEGLWASTASSEDRQDLAAQVRDALFSSADTYHGAEARLKIAQSYFHKDNRNISNPADCIFPFDIEKCAQQCHLLILEHPYAAKECGEAYWMLYELANDYGYEPPKQESRELYLWKACAYNHREALRIHAIESTISAKKKSKRSSDTTKGLYYINDINQYSKYIARTRPEGWLDHFYVTDKYGDITDDWVKSKENQKHFLISDDYDKNLSDLLYLLETMKSYDNMADPYNRIEFYIRGTEEKIAPFIDTALSRMKHMIFPVHILDDSKRSARVLAQHPLFYPIRRIRENEQAILTYVIIGDTSCCEWLLREAFWMMTFRNHNIETNILVLSPNAENFVQDIAALCPGMEQALNGKRENRTGGEICRQFPYIAGKNCSYHSSAMISKIKDILRDGTCYFSIDMGSDTDNAAMAIQIRELSVRKWVSDSEKMYVPNPELPVITFRCQDPDIANLSYRTVVLNEDYGSRWFNNYAVIPFGRLDQQYHWDALTNSLFEELSLNIHLQYYLNDSFDMETEEEDYKEALKTYYRRTYNRDSSMSVCLSIPYRLFQGIGIGEQESTIVAPVLPSEPINILESDTFYSEEAIDSYLEIWRKHSDWRKSCKKPDHEKGEIYDEDSLLYKMGKWEHDRWNRWMISRKWQGVTNRKVVSAYFDEGNRKQQLYIGRIHPLIESFFDVGFFGPFWKKISGENRDFCNNDISSIQRTGEILTRHWTRAAREFYKTISSIERE